MKKRITMADVARQAGVHPTTVSLALRQHPSIPPATRQRIQALAAELGYRPDPALSALMAYRRGARGHGEAPPLAYLTHWDTRWGWKPYYAHAQFHEGATSKAHELGYNVEHFWLGEPGLSHQRLSDILFARGITGILVSSHLPGNDRPLGLDWAKFSAVKIDYFPHEPELHNVTNDQRTITQLAMRHIMAAGYRRIGLVMPRWWDDFADLAWSSGFLAEQQRLAPEEQIPILFFTSQESQVGANGEWQYLVPPSELSAWINRYRPEVLLSTAPFVQAPLRQLGISVPRDIAFADFYLVPDGHTAGVRHNCSRVGALATEILVGQLQQNTFGIPEFPTCTLVEGTWFAGETLPPRTAAPAVARAPVSG